MLMLTAVLLGGFAVVIVQGHGTLIDPAQRSSLWRYGYPGAVVNNDDHALLCGGMGVSYMFYYYTFYFKC